MYRPILHKIDRFGLLPALALLAITPLAQAQEATVPAGAERASGCALSAPNARTPAITLNSRTRRGDAEWVIATASRAEPIVLRATAPEQPASIAAMTRAACADARNRYRGCSSLRTEGSQLILEFHNAADSLSPGQRLLRWTLAATDLACVRRLIDRAALLENAIDNFVRNYPETEARSSSHPTETAEAERFREPTSSLCPAGEIPCIVAGPFEMNFSVIPPGTFQMGSPESEAGRRTDESLHQVTITHGIEIQTTEVTKGQWQSIMGGRLRPEEANLPKTSVSYNEAQNFINQLNRSQQSSGYSYRLPTEAEWEYAARSGTTTAYSFGESPNFHRFAVYSGNTQRSLNVATLEPNPWGLYDIHGNVWEWVSDWYWPTYLAPSVDPRGIASGRERVVRGGAYDCGPSYLRSAIRFSFGPAAAAANVGFRLARTRRAETPSP